MGHGKLRSEKNCLNCNAQVIGRFCYVCGQENVEPNESFWQLVSHFVYDLFHYDGKFLGTLKILLFRPGLLTAEYVRGKRASYLHPIRLYVFTSATFFIIFLSFISGKSEEHENESLLTSSQTGAIQKTIDILNDSLDEIHDSGERKRFQAEIDALKELPTFLPANESGEFFPASIQIDSADAKIIDTAKTVIGLDMPSSLDEYNATQAKLPEKERDGWLGRAAITKMIAIKQKYKYDNKGFQESIKEHFLHYLPTMMFISLPVVALLLQLLYIRRKQFRYAQHGVFSLHIYCAIYILILILYTLGVLNDYLRSGFVQFLIIMGIIFVFYYVYKAMRNFYSQGKWKTVFKFGLFLLSYSFVLIALMVIFLLTSIIEV